MSNQISLTIPNDDPIALRAFGNALEEMAVAHGAVVRKSVATNLTHDHINEFYDRLAGATGIPRSRLNMSTQSIQALHDADDTGADGEFVPFTDEGVDAAYRPDIEAKIPVSQDGTMSNIDADGLPWDARIHSGNQERNADNTWRVRRRPKDLTPEQWAEQVAQVRDELFALMAIPVADPVVIGVDPASENGDYTVEVPVSDESPADVFGAVPPAPESIPVAEIVAVGDSPIVAEQTSGGLSLGFIIQSEPLPVVTIADPVPPAPAPLPPVADPAPAPAPAPLPTVATTGVPATLAELMTWLTSKAPSDDAGRAARLAQINDIVARHGLVTLGQLQKRLDLIPQVYADLVKELGQ